MFNVKVNENKKLNNLSMQNCATSGRSKNSILKVLPSHSFVGNKVKLWANLLFLGNQGICMESGDSPNR